VTDEIYGEIYSQAQTQITPSVRREASLEALSGGDWFYQEINTNDVTQAKSFMDLDS
jgi:hypothetical protein